MELCQGLCEGDATQQRNVGLIEIHCCKNFGSLCIKGFIGLVGESVNAG